MEVLKKIVFIIILILTFSSSLISAKKILIRLKGSYLIYSYDYNQIYGEDIEFQFSPYSVSCKYVKVDVSSQLFYAYGNVILKSNNEKILGDEFLFNPSTKSGRLVNYKERMEIKRIGNEKLELSNSTTGVFNEISFSKIKKSLIYFTGKQIEITNEFEVYGYNVTLYVEGLESLGFKKFKLSDGLKQRKSGFTIDKIWYTKSQGIVGRASFLFNKEYKINSSTQINYEEHSVLKNYYGLRRQIDLRNSTSITSIKDLNLSFVSNYNSSSLWNINLSLNKNWQEKGNTTINFSYNKPIRFKGEAWFGLQSNIIGNKFGDISFLGKYEFSDQLLGEFSYKKTLFNKISFFLSSSYSNIKIPGSEVHSRLLNGSANISYNSQIFNVSTYFYLNHDLLRNQIFIQPQIRIGLNPFNFYGGILSANIYNIFIYNNFNADGIHNNTYSNASVLEISSQSIFIQKNLSLNFNIALEQFLDKEGRNFTSSGIIMKTNTTFTKGISLEGYYSIQSRRKTESWLIEGTTSEDLSLFLRINPTKKMNLWLSTSYDPKNNQWRQSFTNLSIEIIKNWQFYSVINYDFLLKKMNNVELYLIRKAGRFHLRFIWRSLSKQFLVELIPQ